MSSEYYGHYHFAPVPKHNGYVFFEEDIKNPGHYKVSLEEIATWVNILKENTGEFNIAKTKAFLKEAIEKHARYIGAPSHINIVLEENDTVIKIGNKINESRKVIKFHNETISYFKIHSARYAVPFQEWEKWKNILKKESDEWTDYYIEKYIQNAVHKHAAFPRNSEVIVYKHKSDFVGDEIEETFNPDEEHIGPKEYFDAIVHDKNLNIAYTKLGKNHYVIDASAEELWRIILTKEKGEDWPPHKIRNFIINKVKDCLKNKGILNPVVRMEYESAPPDNKKIDDPDAIRNYFKKTWKYKESPTHQYVYSIDGNHIYHSIKTTLFVNIPFGEDELFFIQDREGNVTIDATELLKWSIIFRNHVPSGTISEIVQRMKQIVKEELKLKNLSRIRVERFGMIDSYLSDKGYVDNLKFERNKHGEVLSRVVNGKKYHYIDMKKYFNFHGQWRDSEYLHLVQEHEHFKVERNETLRWVVLIHSQNRLLTVMQIEIKLQNYIKDFLKKKNISKNPVVILEKKGIPKYL